MNKGGDDNEKNRTVKAPFANSQKYFYRAYKNLNSKLAARALTSAISKTT